MKPIIRAMTVAVTIVGLSGCATTSYYYSANDYRGVRVGDSRITGGVSVAATPTGVSVTPRVHYSYPRRKPK